MTCENFYLTNMISVCVQERTSTQAVVDTCSLQSCWGKRSQRSRKASLIGLKEFLLHTELFFHSLRMLTVNISRKVSFYHHPENCSLAVSKLHRVKCSLMKVCVGLSLSALLDEGGSILHIYGFDSLTSVEQFSG